MTTFPPHWERDRHLYDAIEISPMIDVNKDINHVFMDDEGPCFEVCDHPADADMWSLFGHYAPDSGQYGRECLDDYATEAEAVAMMERLENDLRANNGKTL